MKKVLFVVSTFLPFFAFAGYQETLVCGNGSQMITITEVGSEVQPSLFVLEIGGEYEDGVRSVRSVLTTTNQDVGKFGEVVIEAKNEKNERLKIQFNIDGSSEDPNSNIDAIVSYRIGKEKGKDVPVICSYR